MLILFRPSILSAHQNSVCIRESTKQKNLKQPNKVNPVSWMWIYLRTLLSLNRFFRADQILINLAESIKSAAQLALLISHHFGVWSVGRLIVLAAGDGWHSLAHVWIRWVTIPMQHLCTAGLSPLCKVGQLVVFREEMLLQCHDENIAWYLIVIR